MVCSETKLLPLKIVQPVVKALARPLVAAVDFIRDIFEHIDNLIVDLNPRITAVKPANEGIKIALLLKNERDKYIRSVFQIAHNYDRNWLAACALSPVVDSA